LLREKSWSLPAKAFCKLAEGFSRISRPDTELTEPVKVIFSADRTQLQQLHRAICLRLQG
jgi:hypothetical protein